MVSLWSLASATLLIARAANAHFTLTSPSPIGTFDEDEEDNAPCGGYTPDFSSQTPTDFHVGGDSIVTLSTHPQTTWLYRITTDETANGNWSEIYPIWLQSGQGTMCIPSVIINESYVGQKVVLSVVGNGPDGILYQCANLNLVAGAGSTPSSCSNKTGTSGSFTSDASLAALVSSDGASTASPTSGSSSATSTPSAAAVGPSYMEGLPAIFAVGVMMVLGATLTI